MEIRASFDAATLNLAANVAKSDGESIRGGQGATEKVQVFGFKRQSCVTII